MTLEKLIIGLVIIFLCIMLAHSEMGPGAYVLGLALLAILGTRRM